MASDINNAGRDAAGRSPYGYNPYNWYNYYRGQSPYTGSPYVTSPSTYGGYYPYYDQTQQQPPPRKEPVEFETKTNSGLIAAVVIITLLLVGGGIAAAVIFIEPGSADTTDESPSTPTSTTTPVTLDLALKDVTYSDALASSQSTEFMTEQKKYCDKVKGILANRLEIEDCLVDRFLPGSVIAAPLFMSIKKGSLDDDGILAVVKETLKTGTAGDANVEYTDFLTRKNYCAQASQRSSSTCSQICGAPLTETNKACGCNRGYTLNADGKTCDDVDECKTDPNRCGAGNTCVNKPGAYLCNCGGNNVNAHSMLCKARGPCDGKRCEKLCDDSTGVAVCSCPSGYTLNADKIFCTDVDECKADCTDVCTNKPGSYECSCLAGSYLLVDKKTCAPGGVTVATSPVAYTLTLGTQDPVKTISCTITLTGSASTIANSEIKASWVFKDQTLAATVTGSGSTRTVTSYTLSTTISPDNHGQYYCMVQAANMEKYALTQVYAYGCDDDEFKCTINKCCIPMSKKCDGTADCPDKSDETDASCACSNGYKCTNYKCVGYDMVCNGVDDCGDWSDEGTVACATTTAEKGGVRTTTACDGTINKRQCPAKTDMCVEPRKFCDFKEDCPLASDEGTTCLNNAVACGVDTLKCDTNRCISQSRVCDHISDCVDGTDEPTSCGNAVTSPATAATCFKCSNTQKCIPTTSVCDRIVDCTDGSDETPKCVTALPASQFIPGGQQLKILAVANTCVQPYVGITVGFITECIHPDVFCDGIAHLPGGEDEPVGCATTCATATHFVCDGTKCLSNKLKCDGTKNCIDGVDEQNCVCDAEKRLFRCDYTLGSQSPCLSMDMFCDRTIDCPNGEDEKLGCQITCPFGFLRCRDEPNPSNITVRPECIPLTQKCDGKMQCSTGSDEYACSCGAGYELCSDLYGCFATSAKCDGIKDCRDGSDETTKCTAVQCPKGQFKCDNKCMDESAYCNGYYQCKDLSDSPPNCLQGCGTNSVFCDGKCVYSGARCDGKLDCSNGEDEKNCYTGSNVCPGFVCTMGMCIDKAKRCDNVPDCPDNSDESAATCTLASATCTLNGMFFCDGACVSNSLKCDGVVHCKDGSDEAGCSLLNGCGTNKADTKVLRAYYRDEEYSWKARGGVFNTSCDNGQCIAFDRWCDGEVDCFDKSDEKAGCVIGCPASSFKCLGRDECIPMDAKCDGIEDCGDSSDEINCPDCGLTNNQMKDIFGYTRELFTCPDGTCIWKSWTCDGMDDCSDGSDEASALCCTDKFVCTSGQCISMSKVCDGFTDCSDSTDENRCPVAVPKVACTSEEFACDNGNCVPKSTQCDEDNNCSDWSDEKNCPCDTANGFMKCTTSHACIRDTLKCNGKPDCPKGDTSDEAGCGTCAAGEFKCANNHCIKTTEKCDGSNDCGDWSDELSSICPCPSNSFTCSSPSICRPNSAWCDRKKDCPDGSDEVTNCALSCKSGQIACSGRCVDPSIKCDGTLNCPGYEDEINCAAADIPWSMFQCKDKKRILHVDRFCDGVFDCADGTDEPVACRECPPNEVKCAGICRRLSVICCFPSVCPDVTTDITCSTKEAPFVASCGVPEISPNTGSAVAYIINGKDAAACSHPWFVSLQQTVDARYTGSFDHECGGTIISENYILTAAHCFDDGNDDVKEWRVVASEHDLTVTSNMEQIRGVSKLTVHPNYIDLNNDIALVKVDKPFLFNKCVKPICLTNTVFPATTKCIAAGFGRTLSTGTLGRDILKNYAATVQDKGTCLNSPVSTRGSKILCTEGTYERRKATCYGDGGGPLMCQRDGKFYVAGIASYAQLECLGSQAPSVWTDTVAYYDWINQNTGT